jgi:hypothetical protein
VGSAALSCGTILGLVFFWIITNLQIHAPPGTPAVEFWQLPTAITLCVAAAWAAAFYHWRRVTPFRMGALAGFAVGLLIEGLCFGINLH